MSTVLGSGAATEQPIRFGFDWSRGVYTIRTFRGPKAAIDAMIPQLFAVGWSYDVQDGPGGISTVEARIYYDATGGRNPRDVLNIWELTPNRVTKDLLEADLTIINGLNDENIDNINYYLNNPIEPNASTIAKFTNTGNRADAVKVYRLMRAGVKSWPVSQPILKHTYMVPYGVNPGFAFLNIGKILSTQKLISLEGVPNDFLLPLNSLPTVFTSPTRSDSISLAYGWLKHMPSLSVAPYNRREVSMEWEFGLWATDLYTVIS